MYQPKKQFVPGSKNNRVGFEHQYDRKWVSELLSYDIYTGSHDDTALKSDPAGNELWSVLYGGNNVRSIAVTPTNRIYISGWPDIRLYDTSGTEITTGSWPFTGHTGSSRELAVDTIGNVYSVSDNETKKIDSTGSEVWSIATGGLCVVVDAEGYAYVGDGNNDVRKIDSTGTQVWVHAISNAIIRSVAVDPNGFVYAGDDNGVVRKITPAGAEEWQFTFHTLSVASAACAPGLYGSFPTEWS
jgi:streptogramin lyase